MQPSIISIDLAKDVFELATTLNRIGVEESLIV